MRNSTKAIALLGVTAVLFSAVALPASAATTGDTPATTTVTGGTLDIAVSMTSVNLGSAVPGTSTPSTALGGVTVTDSRAGLVGWIASATVSDFTSANVPTGTIPASAVAYTSTTASKTGTVTVTATSPASVATATAVQTATAVSGNNSATWNPTIIVTFPAQSLAATDYVATFTHSVA